MRGAAFVLGRRRLLSAMLATTACSVVGISARAQTDALPSWNNGSAKHRNGAGSSST
jgi:hypothetical protein